MLKIPCYQDTHLPLIRNRFSVEKPDHFQIPSNCTRTKVAGNTLHCAFSSAACHGGTRGTRWVIYSPPPPPNPGPRGWPGDAAPPGASSCVPVNIHCSSGSDAERLGEKKHHISGRSITSGWQNSRCQPSWATSAWKENTGMFLFLMETPLGVGNKQFKCFA